MKRILLIAVILAVASATSVYARAVDNLDGLADFRLIDRTATTPELSDQGVQGTAQPGTTWFGGTVWAADSMRWEAIVDSIWTFDTGVGSHYDFSALGVNPYKYGAPGNPALPGTELHAYMEGWVGFDNTYSELPYFRRVSQADFGANPVCVGTAAGLGGDYSFWAGVFKSEADELCYAGGQGYGNSWNICIEQVFSYNGSGQMALSYDYVVETEPGWDYAYAIIDTTNNGDELTIATYTGASSGSANIALVPGDNLRSDAGDIKILFCVVADGAYSDEDGLNPTTCGAFAVDDIGLSGGGVSHSASFETDTDGWTMSPPRPGPGGEWSNIVHLNDLPPAVSVCECDLVDSVLVFEDKTVGGHGLFQDNLAASPWIDLLAEGLVGSPGKFVEYSFYTELPFLNYIFAQINFQWYPEVCPNTGGIITSPWTSDGFVTYFGEEPICTNPGLQRQRDQYGAFISPGAEQLRVAFGLVNYCRFYANCSGVTNSTPWFDNIRVAVFGNPNAPLIASKTVDRPQDAFPENGTLRLDATGRVDCNNIKGQPTPEPTTSLGDTLCVDGGSGGAEVRVQFAVRPGPGTDLVRFNSWLAGHQFEEVKDGLSWYSARMDTAEVGGTTQSGTWMTAYHESDPNFSGTDSDRDANDVDPLGGTNRLANDIFPDDLFSAGTRINMFFKTRYLVGSEWYTLPDTAKGYEEMEVLPSSFGADSTFNCVLYVDHFEGRGFDADGTPSIEGTGQLVIEPALGAILTGGSNNWENVPWDRWDIRAPDSEQMSFGRPLNTEYGATVIQSLAYKAILWNNGNLDANELSKEDADVLIPWLSIVEPGLGFNNLYVTGNNVAGSMARGASTEPSALRLMNEYMGVNFVCSTVRNAGCPAGGVQDNVACMPLNPSAGGPVANSLPGGRAVQHLAQGNGCPQLRQFDVLEPFVGGVGNPLGDEEYQGPTKGLVQYASIVNESIGGPDYKTVLDGVSVHYRRDPSNCTFFTGNAVEPAVEERLREVFTWFGYTGLVDVCEDPTSGTSVPDGRGGQPTFKTALANFAPNPLVGGARGTIQFTMAREARAKVEIYDVRGSLVKVVFDGDAKVGLNVVHWEGTDAANRKVASGVYFYRLKAGSDEYAKKLVVVRN